MGANLRRVGQIKFQTVRRHFGQGDGCSGVIQAGRVRMAAAKSTGAALLGASGL
ncbi:MAG: hypothetical protein R2854_06165 [Caldilineaceae bacterium]